MDKEQKLRDWAKDYDLYLRNNKERKADKQERIRLIIIRMLKGWSFTGQSREDHQKEVEILTDELNKLLK